MRKTRHNKYYKRKSKKNKSKKQIAGTLNDSAGYMGDHVFIGYYYNGLDINIPIIIHKDTPTNRQIILEKSANKVNFARVNLDEDVFLPTFPLSGNPGSRDNIEFIRRRSNKYTLYLPYLNLLTNIGKINIFDLMNKGVLLIDDNNMDIGYILTKSFILNTNLKDSEIQTSYAAPQNGYIPQFGRTDAFNILADYLQIKNDLKNAESKLPLNIGYINNLKQQIPIYERRFDDVIKQHPFLKKRIEQLEYKYPTLIEPIFLTDEATRYNYENPEQSQNIRIDRTSRILEEGMSKI